MSGEADFVARFPPTIESIEVMRMVLRRTQPPLVSDDEVSLFLTAFTEVAANAVKAHQQHDVVEPIELQVRIDPPAWVAVVDRGPGFDADNPPPLPDDQIDGGLGLVIARGIRPSLTIESGPEGTRVMLPYHPS